MNVDPVEFGRLQAEVEALRRDNDRQLQLLERLDARMEALTRQMAEAKGGWKVLMLLGGGAASLGSGFTWLAQHLLKGSP